MTLEPERPTLDDGENPEFLDFRRRFAWSLPLTVIVATLGMVGERIGWIPPTWLSWIELV